MRVYVVDKESFPSFILLSILLHDILLGGIPPLSILSI